MSCVSILTWVCLFLCIHTVFSAISSCSTSTVSISPNTDDRQRTTAYVIAVGTAASMTDYTQIVAAIVAKLKTAYVIVIDPEPKNPFKNDYTKYVSKIQEVESCINGQGSGVSINKWYIGGHSAGAWTAVQAVYSAPETKSKTKFNVAGYIGFDPVSTAEVSKCTTCVLSVPSIIFTEADPCGSWVANMAYSDSKRGKAFYDVAKNTTYLYNFVNSAQHCVYTNKGCAVGCGYSGTSSRNDTYFFIANKVGYLIEGTSNTDTMTGVTFDSKNVPAKVVNDVVQPAKVEL